jgi:hypothetical protein
MTALGGKDWLALSQLLDVALRLSPEARERWLAELDEVHEPLAPLLRELFAREELSERGAFLNSLPKLTSGE